MVSESVKDVARVIRRAVKAPFGGDLFPRVDVRLPTVGVGGRSDGYGAWQVVTAGLGPDSVVYSVGIGDDVSFDLDLIRQTGATVHGFDPTPEALAWVEAQDLPDAFVMHGVALAGHDGEVPFFPHENPDYVSHSVLPAEHTTAEAVRVPARRLSTLMAELGHSHVDLLKIDIEGAEYGVLEDILASGLDVRQLLVEFHHRFPEIGLEPTRRAIAALRAAGFALFTVSSRAEEFGFVRRRHGASASF